MTETRTQFDRAVRVELTVSSVQGEDEITETVFTSTTDLRKVLGAAKMWKGADEGMTQIRRAFEGLVAKAQADSERQD